MKSADCMESPVARINTILLQARANTTSMRAGVEYLPIHTSQEKLFRHALAAPCKKRKFSVMCWRAQLAQPQRVRTRWRSC